MKLSMWIINRALKDIGYTTVPFIYEGDVIIESARIFSVGEDCKFSPDHVYVGQLADFFTGFENDQCLLAAGNDLILVENGDLNRVFNQILSMFDMYRAWARQLIQASFENDPFQAVLDVIHEQFRCPMLFGQKDLHIFATTSQYTDSEVYDGWDVIKQLCTTPLDIINNTKAPNMENYPESIKTVAIPVGEEEGKHFYYQIRSNCYCNGEMWGHLYIYFNKRSLDPAVLQLARFAADNYGALLDRIVASDPAYQHEAFLFLCDVISGQNITAGQIDNVYWQLKWERQQQLVLYVVSLPRTDTNEVFFDFICKMLKNNSKNEIVFPYNQQILVIAPYNEKVLPRSLEYMKVNVQSIDYICGVSYPFRDLGNLRYAYFQAAYAGKCFTRELAEQGNSPFAYYEDWTFAGLIEYIKENINWRAFVAPELFQLWEQDRDNGTELYKTLFWFLYCNGQATSTAKLLFIHRNTMKYRLDKILSLMKMDVQDSDIIAYLRMCYCFMLKEYPLDVSSTLPAADA